MTTWHAQAVVSLQAVPLLCTQLSPEQHGLTVEHDWPLSAHVAAWHVPAVEPLGFTQEKPAQQSLLAVQTWPLGWHWIGSWQVPPLQMPEQHSPAVEQEVPLSLQAPPSVGIRQMLPNSSPMHCPEQQAVPPTVQVAPSGTQLLALQRRIPWSSGTHGAPLQH
jgi:hypothetical protein